MIEAHEKWRGVSRAISFVKYWSGARLRLRDDVRRPCRSVPDVPGHCRHGSGRCHWPSGCRHCHCRRHCHPCGDGLGRATVSLGAAFGLATTLALVIAVVAASTCTTAAAAATLRTGRACEVCRWFARGDRNVDAHQLFDVAQQTAFVGTAECDRDAVTAGTGRTADAVDVSVRHFRQVVVLLPWIEATE